ncbi:MAG: hypothetical protein Q4E68_11495 [Prevotellaceae bacterium]|nr:hypothetical protein [Prevotellaceae bacterium]
MEQKKPVIVGAAILLCAALYYFLFFVRTPEYSLNLIREAVQKHDVITFERHVDTEFICNKMVDDYMTALSTKESNPMTIGLMNMMKPALAANLKEAVFEAVRGEGNEPSKSKNKGANEITEALKDNIYNDMKFKSASVIYKEGSEAVVAIALVHPDYNKPVELKVKMAQLDSGKWRVKEIANLVEFLGETKRVADSIEKKTEAKKPPQNNKSTTAAKSGKHLSYQEAARAIRGVWKNADGKTFRITGKSFGKEPYTVSDVAGNDKETEVTLTVSGKRTVKIYLVNSDKEHLSLGNMRCTKIENISEP